MKEGNTSLYCQRILARQACLLRAILFLRPCPRKGFPAAQEIFFAGLCIYLACGICETVQIAVILPADCKPFGFFLQFMQVGLVFRPCGIGLFPCVFVRDTLEQYRPGCTANGSVKRNRGVTAYVLSAGILLLFQGIEIPGQAGLVQFLQLPFGIAEFPKCTFSALFIFCRKGALSVKLPPGLVKVPYA